MKQKSKYLLFFIPIFAIWLCALAASSVYDLDISLAIADENSVFGRLFEILGEPPAILFASFNFALIMGFNFRVSEKKAAGILSAIACIGTSAYTMIQTAEYIAEMRGYPLHPLHMVYAALAALFVSAIFIFTALTISERTLKKYYSAACHCAKAAVLTFVIIWALKLFWGRVRFRQLGGDLSLFTPWYLPRGFTGFFSFPSGHTANATVILSCLYYFDSLPGRFRRFRPALTAVLGVWIVIVAISRVVVGAHYLSDVLFGMAVTSAIVYFVRPKKDK